MVDHCRVSWLWFVLPALLLAVPTVNAQSWVVAGFVEEEASKHRIVGAHVSVEGSPSLGSVTNQDGYFSISVPSTDVRLSVSHLGYVLIQLPLSLHSDTTIFVQLTPAAIALETIEVEGAPARPVRASTHRLPVAVAEAIPALAGEVDIQKTLQLLPGIQGGKEGSAGLYVRGGSPGQNLVLLDGMPLYNPSHAYGFFGIFHPAIVKDVEIRKGAFPARFGGRLSSVMDVSMKEGSTQQYGGGVTVGLVGANLHLGGPIIRNRVSLIVAARRTYLDALATPF